MKTKLIFFIILSTGIVFSCNSNNKRKNQTITTSENTLIGKWVRIGQAGPIGFEFKENGCGSSQWINMETRC